MLSVLADGSHCQMQPFAILAPMSAEKERTTPLGARTLPFCSCTLVIFQAIETARTTQTSNHFSRVITYQVANSLGTFAQNGNVTANVPKKQGLFLLCHLFVMT